MWLILVDFTMTCYELFSTTLDLELKPTQATLLVCISWDALCVPEAVGLMRGHPSISYTGLKIRVGHWSMTSQNTQMTSQIASKKYLIGQKLNSAREKNRLSIQVLSYFPVEESAKLL